MEVKKSKSADLESKRLTGFLIGLVVSLSLFLAALEFPFRVSRHDLSDSLSDDLSEEAELLPVDFGTAMPLTAAIEEPSASDRVEVVDDESAAADAADAARLVEALSAEPPQAVAVPAGDMPLPDFRPIGSDSEPLDFRVVEDLPQFPGGTAEFVKWLTARLRYPEVSRRNRTQGKVLVEFIVNTDGSISGLKVVKSLDTYCDNEAIAALSAMPRWQPGIENDKPCRTKVVVPVVFKL